MCYIKDWWDIFLTCCVELSLSLEKKNITVSMSMKDNHWSWNQSKITALIGCFQSGDQMILELKRN